MIESGNFKFIETKIKDLYVIEPKIYEDTRGYFSEIYNKKAFYDAEERTVLAIIRFVDRHIEKIKEMILTETHPEIKENLETMLKTCEAVKYDAPKTFREACQWTAFFFFFSRIYTRDGSGFQLDGLLYPYYEHDIKIYASPTTDSISISINKI